MDPAPPAPGGRITLVFTDIVDSTRMTTALGDAAYRDAMHGPHCRRVERSPLDAVQRARLYQSFGNGMPMT